MGNTKTFEQRLRDLEDKYRLITDNLVDAVWVLDADTLRYQYVTPSIEYLCGFKAEELMGMPIEQRITADSFEKAKAILSEERELYENGFNRKRSMELELIHKDETKYWIEITARFFKDSDHSLKIVGVTKNISNRKQAEVEKNELLQKLQVALEERDRLLEENKILYGLLPICAACKRIRDKQEKWWPIDLYVQNHTAADFTHTVCPDCREVLYSDLSPKSGVAVR